MEGIVFPSHSIMSRPCVPLPQPGGPKRRIIKDDCIVFPQIDDNGGMSAQNGDKARYGRLRKKKLARRLRWRGMRKALLATPVPIPIAV